MAAAGGGATVAVEWDTAHVQISQPSEVRPTYRPLNP